MKALSVRQPFATLLVLGLKQYETRSWKTDHRGPVLIHASKGQEQWQLETWADKYVKRRLTNRGFDRFQDLPFGAIVGEIELTRIRRTEKMNGREIKGFEGRVGNFRPGRFAWKMDPVEVLDDPEPASGNLGLWTYDPEPSTTNREPTLDL